MEKARFIWTGVIALVAFFIGELDFFVLTLLAMCAVDFISGIIKAVVERDLDSRVMFLGGVKKVGVFLVLAVANLTDGALKLDGLLRSITIGYYAAYEGLSVLENLGAVGLPLPSKLTGLLSKLREKGEDKQ